MVGPTLGLQQIIIWNSAVYDVASCLFGSVRPFVCGRSPVWTVWPLTLIFGMRVDLDLGYPGIVSQGRRSKVKVKQWKIALPFEAVVWSRSILGLGFPSSANDNCEWPLPVYWKLSVCQSVGVQRVARKRSIRFNLGPTFCFFCEQINL